jgi:hypothetical protein
MTARSMVLSSSRTLPGQRCETSFRAASGESSALLDGVEQLPAPGAGPQGVRDSGGTLRGCLQKRFFRGFLKRILGDFAYLQTPFQGNPGAGPQADSQKTSPRAVADYANCPR